jgi:hypothetical protein
MAEAKEPAKNGGKAKPSAGGVSYFQGKPVFVGDVTGDVATIFALPAAQTVGVDSLSDNPDDYDAGAEAEAAKTAETSTVSSQSV